VRRFLLVGLTGSIATGKSTVSGCSPSGGPRARRGSPRARGGHARPARAIADRGEFGHVVLQPDGSDRKALGAIVFADPASEAARGDHPSRRSARASSDPLRPRRGGFEGIVLWDAAAPLRAGAIKRWTGGRWSDRSRYQHRRADGARRLSEADAWPGSRARCRRRKGARGLRHRQLGRPGSDTERQVRESTAPSSASCAGRRAREPAPECGAARPRPSGTPPREDAAARPALSSGTTRGRAAWSAWSPDRARDLVVEIGPGRAPSPSHLARAAGRLRRIEIDARAGRHAHGALR
jgi:hypothetical protein